MKNLLNLDHTIEEIPGVKDTFDGMGAMFGKVIFSHRVNKGYTQQELAKKANVGVKTIHRAEGGTSNIGIETYETIFKALSIKPEEYMEELAKVSSIGKTSDKEKTLV